MLNTRNISFKRQYLSCLVLVLLFISLLIEAKTPIEYESLDSLTYENPQEALLIIEQQLKDNDDIAEQWLQVLAGKALYHSNQFSESQTILINIESSTFETENPALIEMIHRLMGQNFYRMGAFDQALNSALKAQLIAEQNNLNWELAQTTNLLAAIQLRSGQIDLALQSFTASLVYFETAESWVDVAKLKNNLGALYIETQQFDLAEKSLADALALGMELNRPTTIISAMVNQVELMVKTNRFEEAEAIYQKCLVHADHDNLSSFGVWCLEAGAEMYQQQGNHNQAISIANQAYEKADLQQLHESKLNSGKVLVSLYAETGDHIAALRFSAKNLLLVENMNNEVLQLKLEEVKALNDIEKTRVQLQFEQQQNQLNNKNQRLIWFVLGTVLLALLISLWLLRSKQRLVKTLHHKQTELAELFDQMRTAKEVNEQLAKTDGLTGLYNRREMSALLDSVYAKLPVDEELTILMIDVDRFKEVNDQYGHVTGDTVLIALSNTLTKLMPKSAKCSRWGGEEFLVLLPGYNQDTALKVAQQLVSATADQAFEADKQLVVTVSVGLKQLNADIQNMDQWVDAADQALYRSKNNGRNQVTVG